jgi:hypothetical protein
MVRVRWVAHLHLHALADQVQDVVQLGEPLVGRSLGSDTQGAPQAVFHNALCTQTGRLAVLCPSGAGMLLIISCKD